MNGLDSRPVIGDEHAMFVQGSVSNVAASCDAQRDPSFEQTPEPNAGTPIPLPR